MSQVKNESPETLSRMEFGGNQTDSDSRPIGSPEHLALVDAIRLNFPEIYEAAEDAETGTHCGEPVACSSLTPVLKEHKLRFENSLSPTEAAEYALRMPRLPRRNQLIAGVFFAALGAVTLRAAAQSVAEISTQQCVWHAGDDPRWAAPQLDESGWQPYSSWKAKAAPPHLWVRCHAGLGLLHSAVQPAIQVSLSSAYQLYLNGALIGAEGDLGNGNSSLNTIRSYPVPLQLLSSDSATAPSTLALRITGHYSTGSAGPYGKSSTFLSSYAPARRPCSMRCARVPCWRTKFTMLPPPSASASSASLPSFCWACSSMIAADQSCCC